MHSYQKCYDIIGCFTSSLSHAHVNLIIQKRISTRKYARTQFVNCELITSHNRNVIMRIRLEQILAIFLITCNANNIETIKNSPDRLIIRDRSFNVMRAPLKLQRGTTIFHQTLSHESLIRAPIRRSSDITMGVADQCTSALAIHKNINERDFLYGRDSER